MDLFDIFLIGASLSMDAFAVSLCKGLSVSKLRLRHALICGLYFGAFQAIMPLLGYFLGSRFANILDQVGCWVAFILLGVIGANMIRESFGDPECVSGDFSFKAMLPLAIATSIDALAVGVSFAAMEVSILTAAILIGVTTFVISAAGVKIGNVFGARYRNLAERMGGIVLILIGIKILLTGLGVFG